MHCPACAATCGPGVTTACDKCGHLLDRDATGITASARVDPDITGGFDSDLTGAGFPTPPPPSQAGTGGPLDVGHGFGGRYHIIRLLGMGGMGAVYQAWDAELEVALALKVIRPDATEDPALAAEIERRFKRELLLARQVTHPNVVRIHDLGEFEGIKYITMPYIQGTDLGDILAQKGTLPVPEALPVASQIAAGLLAAHDAGVVHRDLKPANIMIDAKGQALIADFGIARASGTDEPATAPGSGLPRRGRLLGSDQATRIGTVIGSIDYMAPEQARGEKVDHRADIYAFGLILYRMLVGRRLAAGASDTFADLKARMETEPTRLREVDPKIPEAVDALVSRCLQPDPAARFQTTKELVAALGRLDENGKPIPLPVQLLRSARFWIAAAAAAITIVAGTWIIADRPAPPVPDPIAVLIADFANSTGEPVFDGLLEQPLTVGIEEASFITALPRRDAARIARSINAGTALDESAARLVALREGIKVVLVGAIEKRGSGYRLSIRGVDASAGTTIFTRTADARNRDAVLQTGASLASQVRSSLGDTRAVDPKETFSTASLEAVNAYTRAQELSASGKDQDAIEFYRKAVTIDPKFGRAYGGLALSMTRLGRTEEAAPLWQQALEQTKVMSPREKYRLYGAYYSLVTRNFITARDTYKQLVKEYPADGAGQNNLAVMSFQTLQFKEALDAGRLVRQIYPNNPLYRSNYALYAMYAGDFPQASAEAAKLVKDGLASYDTYLPLAISAIAEGKLDAARDAYAEMAKADETGRSLAAVGLADLALAQGRASEAVTLLQAGIKADRQNQNNAGVATKELVLADALGMQGDVKGAAAAALRALPVDPAKPKPTEAKPTEAQILPAVHWLIAAGKVDEAAKLGQILDNNLEEPVRAYGRVVAAQVARARNRNIDAVDALREALKFADLWLVRFNLGQSYLDVGAAAEAFAEFDRCLTRRGEGYAIFLNDVPTARAVAPLQYWMARAHEGMLLAPQAANEYRAFVASYASDSPDPLLKDARKRLEALR